MIQIGKKEVKLLLFEHYMISNPKISTMDSKLNGRVDKLFFKCLHSLYYILVILLSTYVIYPWTNSALCLG